MFERFTDRSRKVMALANQEAQRFDHEYIGTEHMLLGLLKEGTGVGYHALLNLGVDPLAVRRKLEVLMKAGSDVVPMGKLPQTPRAKKVIEFAIKEARGLNCNYVGTEHMLLGMICEHDGIAALALAEFGIKLDAARAEVRRLLDTEGRDEIGEQRPIERGRLFHIEHSGESFWVEATDLSAATNVWKRRFWRIPPGDEHSAGDPDSIKLVFDGPVWR